MAATVVLCLLEFADNVRGILTDHVDQFPYQFRKATPIDKILVSMLVKDGINLILLMIINNNRIRSLWQQAVKVISKMQLKVDHRNDWMKVHGWRKC